MIPRYQRIAYWCLVAGIALLLLLLVRGCQRDHQRITAMRDQSPIPAPTDIPNAAVSIALASDADGSVSLDTLTLPLPEEPAMRAAVVLNRVLSDDSMSNSTHPVPAVPAVTDVFLLPLPLQTPGNQGETTSTTPVGLSAGEFPQGTRFPAPTPPSPYGDVHGPGARLAVVNLTRAFADQHPSGIETEDLTLRVIIATLHANMPEIEEVRFLVDGQPRPTLNGHADLSRPYAVADPTQSIHVLSPDGKPI